MTQNLQRRSKVRNAAKNTLEALANSIHPLEVDSRDVVLELSRVLQVDGYTCGVQSVIAILRFHGRGRSILRTFRLLETTEGGTMLAPIRNLFRARGLRPVILRKPGKASLMRAINERAPLLVSMDGDHWSVVYGYGPGAIYLMDPSLRRAVRVRWRWSDFKKRWDGWAMAVHRDER